MTLPPKRFLSSLPAIGTGFIGTAIVAMASSAESALLAITAVFGIAFASVVILFPELGFLATSFVVPIERLGRFGDDSTVHFISLMRIVGAITLASVLLHMAIRKQELKLDVPIFLYTGFFLVSLIGLSYAQDPLATEGHVTTILGNLMFFFLIINVVRSWSLARLAVRVWIVATVLIALYTVFDWYLGDVISASHIGDTAYRFSTVWNSTSEQNYIGAVRRAMGTTSNAAVYGINLILTLPFIFYLFRSTQSKGWRLVILLSGLLILYNLLLTNTRAVMVFAPLTILLCGFRRLYQVTPGMLLTILLVGGGGLALVVPDSVYKRALDPANYSSEHSNNITARFALWATGLRVVHDNWLIGIGAGNRTVLAESMHHPDFDPDSISVHNEYLQTMIDTGIFGWAFFIAFLGWVMWYSFRLAALFRKHPETEEQYWFMIACQIAMISVALFAVQVDVFHFPLKGWWLVAGLVCAMHLIVRESENSLQASESMQSTKDASTQRLGKPETHHDKT